MTLRIHRMTTDPDVIAFGSERARVLAGVGKHVTQVYDTDFGRVTVRVSGEDAYISGGGEYGKYLSADRLDRPGVTMGVYDWSLGSGKPSGVKPTERNGLPYVWRNASKTKLITYDHGGNSRHVMLRPEEGFSLASGRLQALYLNSVYVPTLHPVHAAAIFKGVLVYASYAWSTVYNLQPVFTAIDFWAAYDGVDKPFTKFASIPVTERWKVLGGQYRLNDYPFFSPDGSMFVIGVVSSPDDLGGRHYPLVGTLHKDDTTGKFSVSYDVRLDSDDKPASHPTYGLELAEGQVFFDIGKGNRVVCATLLTHYGTPGGSGDMWIDDYLARAGTPGDRYQSLHFVGDAVGDITRVPIPLHIDIRYHAFGWIEAVFQATTPGGFAMLLSATMFVKQQGLPTASHLFMENADAGSPSLLVHMLGGVNSSPHTPRAIGKVASLDEKSYFIGYTPLIDVYTDNVGVVQVTDAASFFAITGVHSAEFLDISTFNACADARNDTGPYLGPFDMFDSSASPLFALCDVRLG